MGRAHILGFPRIGAGRELKFAVESFWRGNSSETSLLQTGAELRERHWALQRASLDFIAVGDFSYYDHMLDTAALLGALPRRFGFDARTLTLAQRFELARGNAGQPAMEMTKWFDTNYHYLVPELEAGMRFMDGSDAWFDDITEAMRLGGRSVKPVLVGPLTWLWLSKAHGAPFDRLSLMPALVEAYERILWRLAGKGIEWVQLDEPALCLELDDAWLRAGEDAYRRLGAQPLNLLLATYFDSVENIERVARWPVQGFHVDLVRAPQQLDAWRKALPPEAVLSAGVVDGRNVWRCDLRQVLGRLQPLHDQLDGRLWVAPSCSLLHVPVSLAGEQQLDPSVANWLAFATEKLVEVGTLARGLNEGAAAIAEALAASDASQEARRTSRRVVNEAVRRRAADVTDAMATRTSAFEQRIAKQRAALRLPLLPTTTIGSFPQTSTIRRARTQLKQREIDMTEYEARMREEIRHAVEQQEALGLDVLVHGEAERNDMVEYFGERLRGYAFTANGWVQSYGSRCVKPPILYGDVLRPEQMTVQTAVYAQSLTAKPMKGMLTGPVTMLQWSFVRDDLPRDQVATQLALAIRDEVLDLERAGIRVIQIDEPAFREGLPLKRQHWTRYLEWAVHAFKLTCGGVRDETQIHTHMCYSEFNDILPSIAAMDADVITIETSRSAMELLDGFGRFSYPNEIGPGVYDIHSPRVPSTEAMVRLLERACTVIPPQRLWVNPDCGLKTRGWPETTAALQHMVQAARALRKKLQA